MLFSKPLHQVDFQDVKDFCQAWPEGIRVEYKQALQTNHIPKTISSFANTVGGIWIIGVKTDPNNRPIFPIEGFPREAGIEERITQSCYQNLYPALLPDIKIIDVPGSSSHVVVVVSVPESIEAPHAIENTTRVYVRSNSTTERIDLAEIDRIDYLLKRRRDPESKREEMFVGMGKRSCVRSPALRVWIGPQYPYRPVFSGDVLAARINAFASPLGLYPHIPTQVHRIRDGFISPSPLPSGSTLTQFHFEANLYGMVAYDAPIDVLEGNMVRFEQIVIFVGRAVKLARILLAGTTTNLLIRGRLEGVLNRLLVHGENPDPHASRWRNSHFSLEDTIEAEVRLLREKLDDNFDFIDQIVELTYQLMWSFNWQDRAAIKQRTHEILQASGIP